MEGTPYKNLIIIFILFFSSFYEDNNVMLISWYVALNLSS